MSMIITEEKVGRKSIYHLKSLDEAGIPVADEIYSVKVQVSSVIVKNNPDGTVSETIVNGVKPGHRTVITVLNQDGTMNEDAYDYINNIRVCESLK